MKKHNKQYLLLFIAVAGAIVLIHLVWMHLVLGL